MTTKELLERISSEDFESTVWPAATTQRLRHLLLATPEVRTLREALTSGELSENRIREFVSSSMLQLRRGVRFDFEVAFAAIAVALESYFAPIADEYLAALAGLAVPELGVASRVAQEVLRKRATGTTTTKVFCVQPIDVPVEPSVKPVGSASTPEQVPELATDAETTHESYPEIAHA
jgi:hypothetical protein